MTYSILAVSKDRSLLGIGVVSGSYDVGSRVPWLKYKIGAVATQAYTNPSLGPIILNFIEKGYTAKEALNKGLSLDPGRDFRQVAVLTYNMDKAVYSGKNIPKPYNQYFSDNVICIGNLLFSEDVIISAYKAFTKKDDIIAGIISALEAAHAEGGDARGDLSSAIVLSGDDPRLKNYNGLLKVKIEASSDPVLSLKKMLSKFIPISI